MLRDKTPREIIEYINREGVALIGSKYVDGTITINVKERTALLRRKAIESGQRYTRPQWGSGMSEELIAALLDFLAEKE